MTLVDAAVYRDGRRILSGTAAEVLHEAKAFGGMAWVGLYRPDAEEMREIASALDLHPLAVEDTLVGHQRAKLERYGDMTFLVLQPARYMDDIRDGGVRRGARVRRAGLRDHRPPRREPRPRGRPAPARRESPSSSRSDPMRWCGRSATTSSTSTCRSCRASRTTSTRSRTQLFSGEPDGVQAHLRPAAGSHRPAARDDSARAPCSTSCSRS